jgi:hypothetical protein
MLGVDERMRRTETAEMNTEIKQCDSLRTLSARAPGLERSTLIMNRNEATADK